MQTYKYYFVEIYYQHLTTKRENEARLAQYGEVGHDERGAYWKVAKSKTQVSNALAMLGYALVETVELSENNLHNDNYLLDTGK